MDKVTRRGFFGRLAAAAGLIAAAPAVAALPMPLDRTAWLNGMQESLNDGCYVIYSGQMRVQAPKFQRMLYGVTE
jgi:hypothetical protein